jgi:predicted RNA methylase
VAKRYREKGLDKTAQLMVEFLEQRGIEGSTVLEVGGGVGEIQIELLKRGAARAVNLELSPAYEEEATRLLREAGLEERAERILHDVAADPADVVPADVVVLHRVVCCYPDFERLLGAAADHARRYLSSATPHGVRSLVSSSLHRTSSSDCCDESFGRSLTRRRGCSAFSRSADYAAPSPTTRSSGR